MKDMNKQIVNCFAVQYKQWLTLSKNCHKLSSINSISRHLSQTSNQRTISLNNNQTESDQKVFDKSKANISVTFVRSDGQRLKGWAKEGDSLLDVVINNDIDLDGFGACEGTLACSTCHLIFAKEDYDRIKDKPTDEELDMLDLAYDLSETSRLGCQVILNKDMDGLEVRVPSTVNDMRTN